METSCGEGLETFNAFGGCSFYFDGLAPAWLAWAHSRDQGVAPEAIRCARSAE